MPLFRCRPFFDNGKDRGNFIILGWVKINSKFESIVHCENVKFIDIKDLIRRDFGVSILAKSVCLDELKKGKIVALPVENLSMMREINIAYRTDFTQFDILHDVAHIYNETVRLYK